MLGHDQKPKQNGNGFANRMAQFRWKLYFTNVDLFCRYKSDITRTLSIFIACDNALEAWLIRKILCPVLKISLFVCTSHPVRRNRDVTYFTAQYISTWWKRFTNLSLYALDNDFSSNCIGKSQPKNTDIRVNMKPSWLTWIDTWKTIVLVNNFNGWCDYMSMAICMIKWV